jgi:hypothetical protein
MWPRTWKDTAENRPMQMDWLRLTPIAMKHVRVRKNCRVRETLVRMTRNLKVCPGWHLNDSRNNGKNANALSSEETKTIEHPQDL